MKLTTLEIDNFMSVKNVRTRLDNKGLVLIRGENETDATFSSNGSGKSTIFSEAPCWCLFGETIRNLKGDAVVNRQVGKNTIVSIEIEDDNKDTYRVTRHRKHSKHKNKVYLYKNDKDITGLSDKETNAMIESILQMDFLTFTNSIMFGQGLSKMFANSTDGEQKKILERILQIDIFEKCKDIATEYHKDIDRELRDISIMELSNEHLYDEKKTLLRDFEEKERRAQNEYQQKLESLNSDLEFALKRRSESKSPKKLIAEIEQLKANVPDDEELKKSIKEYKKHLDVVNEDLQDETVEFKTLHTKLMKAQKQLHDYQKGDNTEKVCEACGQPLPVDDTTAAQEHLKKTIAALETELKYAKKDKDESEKLYNTIQSHVQKYQQELDSIIKLERDIQSKELSVEKLKSNIRALDDLVLGTKEKIKQHEESSVVTYADTIAQLKKELKEIQKEIEEMAKERKVKNELAGKYIFWKDAFGNRGIKSAMLDSVTPFLNTRANYYLTKLTNSSIEVLFNTQTTLANGEKRDKFSVDVINENGDNSYIGNSGGEKRRIDIAISMALQDLVQSRTNKSMDVVVYDEAFENLDEVGCANVIDILQEKAKDYGSVFVITHNDSLQQMFNQAIVIQKGEDSTLLSEVTA